MKISEIIEFIITITVTIFVLWVIFTATVWFWIVWFLLSIGISATIIDNFNK